MNNNIYQIGQDYLNIMAQIEANDGELSDELMEQLEQNEADFQTKASNYVKMIRMWEGEASVIDAEIKRLQSLKKSRDGNVDRLKENLHQSMIGRGLDKVDLGLFKLSFRKSTAVIIDDQDLIPDKYKEEVTTIKVDKIALKKALANEEVEGAYIETRQNLQIK